MLGLMHLLLWLNDRRSVSYALSVLMSFAAATVALVELSLLNTLSVPEYSRLLQWQNLWVCVLLVSMVWLVYAHLGTARRWLAATITAMWSLTLVVNFAYPASVVFSEISELRRISTFRDESFTLAIGIANPWKLLPDLATVVILLYVIDAANRSWRRGARRPAGLFGGSVVLFMVLAGIHAPLVDAGVVATPYMVSFAFLAIVLAMSYELVSDAVRVSRYARQIEANERRWRSLLQKVQLAIVGVTPGGEIDYVNPFFERISGYGANDILGRPATALAPPADLQKLERALQQAGQGDPEPHSEWTLLCANGEQRKMVWSSVSLFDGEGAVSGFLGIGEDVTERLRSRAELQRTQREIERLRRVGALGELASALAHELNQPLTAILSNAQAARRFMAGGDPDLGELREIIDDIIRDDKRAGEVIHSMRAMVRKGEIDRESFAVDAAIEEVISMLGSELDGQGITIILDFDPALPEVQAGRVEIQQVMMNLVLNAANAMTQTPAGQREIKIAACGDGDGVRVTVHDTGRGLEPEEQGRLFDPFFTTRPEGLGMGLAICRRIIDSHGGRIWARDGKRGGAAFSFTLPAAKAAAA